jgi:hypothetical protein
LRLEKRGLKRAGINFDEKISLVHHLAFAVGHVGDLTVDTAGDGGGINRRYGAKRVNVNADVAGTRGGGGDGCAGARLLGLCSGLSSFLMLAIKIEDADKQQYYKDDPDPRMTLTGARILFRDRFWRRRRRSGRTGCRCAGRVFRAD